LQYHTVMDLSKWLISPTGRFLHPGFNQGLSRIIYVEDHSIFRTAIQDYCIRPFLKNIELIEFTNGDLAFDFIKKEIIEDNRIDIILTDINHPGMKGNDLIKNIRDYEGYGKKKRTPIMVISMVEEKAFPELQANKLVDIYLTKIATVEEIVDGLEEILYTKTS